MRKIVAAVCIIFVICSCGSNSGQKKGSNYYMTLTYVNDQDGRLLLSPEGVEAANDTAAYLYALNYLDSLKSDPLCALTSDDNKEHPYHPTSFELRDASGNVIVIEGVETERMKAERERLLQEQKKAFAGAEFGMSQQEVLALDYYKGWYKSDNTISKSWLVIGNEQYKVRLFFEDDALYLMTFTSILKRSANRLDNEITKEVENFKDIIVNAYGAPTSDYGIPSILRLKSGYISYAYIWDIGAKNITIGIEEDSHSAEFNMYAEIKNTEVTERMKAEREAEKKDRIEEASSLF